MKRTSHFLQACWVSAVVLAGCGGSDGPTTPVVPPTPEPLACQDPPEGVMTVLPHGVYGGTIEGVTDGRFVLVTRAYDSGEDAGVLFMGPNLVALAELSGVGLFWTDGACSSNDTGVASGRALGSLAYVHLTLDPAAPSVTGTLRLWDSANTTYMLAGGPIAGSTFDPKARPQVDDFVGDWTLTTTDGEAITLSIAPDGKLKARHQGCDFTGSASPDAELNLLSMALQIQPAGCLRPNLIAIGAPFEGFALLMPIAGGGSQLLLHTESNNGFDYISIAAIGRR